MKRKTIGLFINELQGRYQGALWPGVVDTIRQNGAHLIIFDGNVINENYTSYRYQHNVIYNLGNRGNLDGIILVSAAIAARIGKSGLEEFCEQFRGIPIVSIALTLEGIPSIRIDNANSMKKMITHFIEHHGSSRFLFIEGSRTNEESRLRLEGFKQALNEYGIEDDPGRYFEGHFYIERTKQIMNDYIQKRGIDFDAIIASNDEMAIGCIEVLRSMGIRVPEDVPVAGFDDILEAGNHDIPLTTVSQDIYSQGNLAVRLLLDMIDGREVPAVSLLPTRLIIRRSCGCYEDYYGALDRNKDETADDPPDGNGLKTFLSGRLSREDVSTLVDILFKKQNKKEKERAFLLHIEMMVKKYITLSGETAGGDENLVFALQEAVHKMEKWFAAHGHKPGAKAVNARLFREATFVILKTLQAGRIHQKIRMNTMNFLVADIMHDISTAAEREEIFDAITAGLIRLGMSSCYICLYDRTYRHSRDDHWTLPETTRLVYLFRKEQRVHFELEELPFRTGSLLPDNFPLDKGLTGHVIEPLYFQEEQYGYIIYNLLPGREMLYDTLSYQISISLKNMSMSIERQYMTMKLNETLLEMEEYNKQLLSRSKKDAMTGLWNQSGFMERARVLWKENERETVLTVYCEMENLKEINEHFGYAEGDAALLDFIRLIRDALESRNLLMCRMRGNGFLLLIPGYTMADFRRFRDRLGHNIPKKAYSPVFDLVGIEKKPGASQTLEDTLLETDKLFYRERIRRKEHSGISASGKNSFITDVQEFIGKHYMEDINLDHISRQFKMSKYYLSRMFHKLKGVSLSEYITQTRLDEAVKLLENTDQDITHIAYNTGYNNSNYFHVVFKRKYGITPGEYRQNFHKEH
ncbi:MAG: substrate-binding domain-containing protein [Spirochaetales bacterium]|nr:substrate-binding domain-containing protein [Spirochaetales bacterium]